MTSKKRLSKKLSITSSIVVGITLFIICLNGSPTVSKQDALFINSFLTSWSMQANAQEIHSSMNREVEFISRVQDSIVSQIAHEVVSKKEFGNVRFYFENKKGQCFDRSILLEKILKHFGFKVRHAFIFFTEGSGFNQTRDFFSKGTQSHALTEVKTKEGWMAVGTNADWIGYTTSGAVLTLKDLRHRLKSKLPIDLCGSIVKGEEFWKAKNSEFRYVYGLYSRHGRFMKPYTFIPDFNLRMLFYNLGL